MIPKYFDVHSHLNFPDYGNELPVILSRMKKESIWTICVGTSLKDSKEAVALAQKHEGIFACVGIHPIREIPKDSPWELEFKGSPWEFDEVEFEKLVKHPKVVAVGECGLDYFRIDPKDEKEKNRQRELFKKQIEFALKHDKPLMIHSRSAYDELAKILGTYSKDSPWELESKGSPWNSKIRGNIHFFSGDLEQARKFIDLGFTLSFAGPITFPPRVDASPLGEAGGRQRVEAGARDYDEVIRSIPVTSILSETDSPFAAPAPFRGKRNEPSYVLEVVKKIAEIRGENLEFFSKILVENASKLFKIKP